MERTCRHCGYQLPEAGGLFCPQCRKPLIEFAPAPPPPPEASLPSPYGAKNLETDRPQARNMAVMMSLFVYAIIVATFLNPGNNVIFGHVFGREPPGMSPTLFVFLLFTILFLPFPWVIYHFGLIQKQASRDGLSGTLYYIFRSHSLHPHLRRSKLIFLGGIVYNFATSLIWIVFSSE